MKQFFHQFFFVSSRECFLILLQRLVWLIHAPMKLIVDFISQNLLNNKLADETQLVVEFRDHPMYCYFYLPYFLRQKRENEPSSLQRTRRGDTNFYFFMAKIGFLFFVFLRDANYHIFSDVRMYDCDNNKLLSCRALILILHTSREHIFCLIQCWFLFLSLSKEPSRPGI